MLGENSIVYYLPLEFLFLIAERQLEVYVPNLLPIKDLVKGSIPFCLVFSFEISILRCFG